MKCEMCKQKKDTDSCILVKKVVKNGKNVIEKEMLICQECAKKEVKELMKKGFDDVQQIKVIKNKKKEITLLSYLLYEKGEK